MDKIPTAEEFYKYHNHDNYKDFDKTALKGKDVKKAMIEFARLHGKSALEAAANKATVTPIDHEEISEGSFRPIWGVDDDSILNAYPLNLIK